MKISFDAYFFTTGRENRHVRLSRASLHGPAYRYILRFIYSGSWLFATFFFQPKFICAGVGQTNGVARGGIIVLFGCVRGKRTGAMQADRRVLLRFDSA
jgi:hypothetical protein